MDRRFELQGSREHYPPSKVFNVKHIRLYIKPDFDRASIECKEDIIIVSNRDALPTVTLDAAELNIRRVVMNEHVLNFRYMDDKLRIELSHPINEGDEVTVSIEYDAKPRKGLYFIKPDEHYPKRRLQLWTQGESEYSKYWFVCFDHPDMRFTHEMIVEVPNDMIAVSNGRLVTIKDNGSSKVYHWSEDCMHPAYLTSLVVGRFEEIREEYNGIELIYYVPNDMLEYAELSFKNTKDMMRFFEEYTGVRYPYSKYAQITVDEFIYGGMENINATTLTIDTLHDKRAHIDFTSDHLVAHELAHQWFGDLVTCRDWQHIWLNESFATYFEALYWLHSRGEDEFNYYIMQYAEEYFDEVSKRYSRPIVTNVYKYADDLFDRHAYEKGACVLHMLRSLLGDKMFRRAVKRYLERFRFSSAETEEFRRCCEDATGVSLQEFFDQWLYRHAHPELKVQMKYDIDNGMLTIGIQQVQESSDKTSDVTVFRFPLDIHIVSKDKDEVITLNIDSKEHTFQIRCDEPVYVSIDPYNKIPLKKVNIKAPNHMLINALKRGNAVERINAARTLSGIVSNDTIDALKNGLNDTFWGVVAEAAKSLSSIKSDDAYKVLIESYASIRHPKARRAVVRAIGEFRKEESIPLLNRILQEEESYYVQAESVVAIGKSKSKKAIPYIMGALQIKSHNEVVRAAAMSAFGEVNDEFCIPILIDHTRLGEHNRVREAATLALGKYAKGNEKVIEHLTRLLGDYWFRIRINAIKALTDAQDAKTIKELEYVADNDVDARVRRIAEEVIVNIRQSLQIPKEVSEIRSDVERLKGMSTEILQRLERIERESK